MELSKQQLCEKLSEDYAERANRGGANYEDAYSHYLDRCLKRETEDLSKHYIVAGLHTKENAGFLVSGLSIA